MSAADDSESNSPIQISQELVNRLKNYMNDPVYKEAVENSSTYNERLVKERKLRLPFIDAQTGVAQSDCYIWSSRLDRMPGYYPAQLYSYPARRWRKKRRQYLLTDHYAAQAAAAAKDSSNKIEPNQTSDNGATTQEPGGSNGSSSTVAGGSGGGGASSSLLGTGNVVQNGNCITNATGNANNSNSSSGLHDGYDDSKDSWLRGYDDDGSDLPDAGELDDPESDYDDYEEYSASSKKKKAAAKRKETVTKKKRSELTDSEKPYHCEICGARYKTRPGLSYHYSHSHQDGSGSNGALSTSTAAAGNGSIPDDDFHFHTGGSSSSSSSAAAAAAGMKGGHFGNTNHHQQHPHMHHMLQLADGSSGHCNSIGSIGGLHPQSNSNHLPNNSSTRMMPSHGQDTSGDHKFLDSKADHNRNKQDKDTNNKNKSRASPSNYCDFCLGDSTENKKTRSAEDLVSCSDCGRSAHPSCLQFTANMILSVKKYRWQCIECKSCGLCGTSDNDDQLLFCDDCDRGYHMYCLKPPLTEPPEGSWSCHLCIEEYHRPKPPPPPQLTPAVATAATAPPPPSASASAAPPVAAAPETVVGPASASICCTK